MAFAVCYLADDIESVELEPVAKITGLICVSVEFDSLGDEELCCRVYEGFVLAIYSQ